MTDVAAPKIAQLVADARTELKRFGIDTDGKRSDEILSMARERRNNPAQHQLQDGGERNAGLNRLASAARREKALQ